MDGVAWLRRLLITSRVDHVLTRCCGEYSIARRRSFASHSGIRTVSIIIMRGGSKSGTTRAGWLGWVRPAEGSAYCARDGQGSGASSEAKDATLILFPLSTRGATAL